MGLLQSRPAMRDSLLKIHLYKIECMFTNLRTTKEYKIQMESSISSPITKITFVWTPTQATDSYRSSLQTDLLPVPIQQGPLAGTGQMARLSPPATRRPAQVRSRYANCSQKFSTYSQVSTVFLGSKAQDACHSASIIKGHQSQRAANCN
jgi:hypothetical protein